MATKMTRREIAILIAAGVTLLVLANIYDYNVFNKWIVSAFLLNPFHVYNAALLFGHEFRVVYPPLVPLFFLASVALIALINPLMVLKPIPPLPVRLALKLPILASYYAIYAVLKRSYGERSALLYATSIATLISLLVFTTDLPGALLALLALELAPASPLVAGFTLALAAMLKQSFALLLLPILIYYKARGEVWEGVKFALSFTVASTLLLAPFIASNGIGTLLQYVVMFHAKRLPQGLNPWVIPLYISGYNARLTLSVSRLWLIPFTLLTLHAVSRAARNPSKDGLLVSSAAIFMVFLLTSKVVNPAYVVWVVPIVAALAPRRRSAERALKLINVAALLLSLHFALYYISAAVANKPIYIEEEMRWMPPTEVRMLVEGALPGISDRLLALLRNSPLAYLFTLIYDEWRIIATLLAISYITVMSWAYILITGVDVEHVRRDDYSVPAEGFTRRPAYGRLG